MPTPSHTKIINKVARKILKEYGIERKGQSRTWLDDQYWFTTIIEFQPFKDRQGTCLNVGVNFHWYEKDYFSFDIGNRVSEFIDYKNDKQFESEMESLVELAIKQTLELREKLKNLDTAISTIINYKFTSDRIWGNYHRAIICGLNGGPKKSKQYFDLILNETLEYDWQLDLKQKIENLKMKLNNDTDFQDDINLIIERTRIEKKLKQTEIKNVW